MLTGRQIRAACALLKWDRFDLQRSTALPLFVIDRVMISPGAIAGMLADEIIIKDAFHRAGVDLRSDGITLTKGGV